MVIRRALLFMPGDSRRKIEKGAAMDVDSIIMDLEDGVALNNKPAARQTTAEALRDVAFGRSERLVRINAIGNGLYVEDIDQTVAMRPDGYVLPKVESAGQVHAVSHKLAEAEQRFHWPPNSITLLAIIETAMGVVRLREIAGSDPRLSALIFGAEDLAGDIGATRSSQGWEVFYARSAVVIHAKAYGLQAIDTLVTDLTMDDAGLEAEARHSLEMGFTGKLAIHPRQVEPIQRVFTPTAAQIAQAQRLIRAHDEQQAAGTGVFELDGKMVDMPMVRAAEAVLARARAAGVPVDDRG